MCAGSWGEREEGKEESPSCSSGAPALAGQPLAELPAAPAGCHSLVSHHAHIDVTLRLSVAIGAAQHFLHCPDFSLFILRAAHPSFLPSFLRPLQGSSPHLMVKVPPDNAIPPVPLGCVPGGSWAAPPIPNVAFSNQLYIFQGQEEPVSAQPDCGGDRQGSCGCSQCRCWRCCWLSFRAGFSYLGRAGGTSWLLWQDVGWAGLPFPLKSFILPFSTSPSKGS